MAEWNYGRDGLSRRRFLQLTAGTAALAACTTVQPDPSVTGSPAPSGTRTASPEPTDTPEPTPAPSPTPEPEPTGPVTRTLFRGAALADARSARLRLNVSVLVEEGRITWLRPADDEGDPGDSRTLEFVDAAGATIVPGMVDCHSHLTLPGGAHWIDRVTDSPGRLARVAEHNARIALAAGVRWFRDVGAPRAVDPVDGRERALSLGIRDRWAGKREYPYVRAAGTWLTQRNSLPDGVAIEVDSADELLDAAIAQLDDGSDLVKLYLDGPDPGTAPWSAAEVRRVVEAVHDRDRKVTAHSTRLAGARVGAEAGVDAIEHGFDLDSGVARTMAGNGVALVSTLTVNRSVLTFGRTTDIARFASSERQAFYRGRHEAATASVAAAHRAGVAICAGTDFGGGSSRPNQLAWEVELLVGAGLEPWEALAAATWRGGELLGEPDAGTIREGGPADFFLVHGDPLSDPAALWRVWRVA